MNRPLSDLNLKISYRTGRDDLINDFYIPCLNRSILYQRAVGYFNSTGLSLAASGIAHLIAAGGKIELLASPQLTQEDIDAIQKGHSTHKDVVIQAVQRNFIEIQDLLIKERLEALAWMVSTGDLKVKLAIRMSPNGVPSLGIYHEKLGLFSDSNLNRVAFAGSANETGSALFENFEAIDVYCSWEDPQNRVTEKTEMFSDLWSNGTPGLDVIDFTEVTADILRPYTPKHPPLANANPTSNNSTNTPSAGCKPDFPSWLKLRGYQELAVRNWFDNDGQGTLKMATGSGKTITALSIITHLYQKAGLKAALVLCPYKHLVDQWAKESQNFSINPLIIHTSRTIWSEDLNRKLLALQNDEDQMLLVLTTNRSFADNFFQRKLLHFPKNTVLVADEAHNLGAKDLRTKLPDSIRWRLALSATPERWFDDEGTDAIFDYFGKVLEPEFTLEDALKCGALAPYRYYPILVELTEDEQDEYLALSKKIAEKYSNNGFDKDDKALSFLLFKRARLMASAENKLPILKDLMGDKAGSKHWLFYCGDDRVEDQSSQEEMRQIESVCRILGRELHMKIASFTAETPRDTRQEISKKLDTGELQGLVAIRCLDEGVDIPSTEKAVILASSTNPRQFIQRRGRVLRKPTKDSKKVAEIYDMITIPPLDSVVTDSERSMLRKELVRFAEFAKLSQNAGVARKVILELQKKYELMDI
ncbi:MAG TPA: DEAD/DEAH box helicase [Candidatus Poseidoniales archaeon]|nr:MAG TPA: DEAD/DEAH box helicase [Candidatus Poseidoniales archaeon]HII62671.1 DEAD/DEAH box helicase family protein [Candidatus Poseidoniaceae archaeon]|tara:strand:- start:34060 stop:36168 length:2109 start_codon:yes stop_codon:yes gene_type:complete